MQVKLKNIREETPYNYTSSRVYARVVYQVLEAIYGRTRKLYQETRRWREHTLETLFFVRFHSVVEP